MNSPRIVTYPISTQRRAARISEERWNSVRPFIEDLYMRQRLSLKQVMSILETEHDFHASRRQYEYQFNAWDMTKYTPQKVMRAICRKAEQHPGRKFSVKGAPVSEKAIQRFRGRHTDGSPARISDAPTPSDLEWASPSQSTSPSPLDNTSLRVVAADLEPIDDFNESGLDLSDEYLDSVFSQYNILFTSSDPASPEQSLSEQIESSDTAIWPQHQWQDPKDSLILQNLEIPSSKRTPKQQWHTQMLVWSLWMCGDHSCLNSLVNDKMDRGHRLEGDIKRFESIINHWMCSSTGCPDSMSTTTNLAHAWTDITPHHSGSFQPEERSSNMFQQRPTGLQDWRSHALFGIELASLKATGKSTEAKQLSNRLLSDLSKTPNSSAFFFWFGRLLRLCQGFLITETSKLRNLPRQLRNLINEMFEGSSSSDLKEFQGVGILAFLCYQRWTQDTIGSSKQWEKQNWEKLILQETGFTPMRAFLWVARILLFHSQGSVKTLAPSAICGQALNGMSHIAFESNVPASSLEIQNEQCLSPSTWVKWLSDDSAWFLPMVSRTQIPDNESSSIWGLPGGNDPSILR